MRHDGRIRPGGAEGRTLVWFSFWPGPFYKGRVEGTLQASTRIERHVPPALSMFILRAGGVGGELGIGLPPVEEKERKRGEKVKNGEENRA